MKAGALSELILEILAFWDVGWFGQYDDAEDEAWIDWLCEVAIESALKQTIGTHSAVNLLKNSQCEVPGGHQNP